MKVLVLGGAGYVGSHMVRRLLEAGHDVLVFDNLSTGHRAAIGDAQFMQADLLDPDAIDVAVKVFQPDAAMHFAARSLVGESVTDPVTYYRHNVGGTLNLLDALRRNGAPRLVFSSTAALFGVPKSLPILEDDAAAPINPYGWSKRAAEAAIADACTAYGLRACALRYFNAAGADPSGTIGESHTPETHLIPNVLRAAAGTGPALKLFGDDFETPDGTCVRDYVHVNDLADAHLLAVEALGRAELPAFQTYNLGNGQGFSVREVLASAQRVVGRPIPHSVVGRRPGDPPSLVASSRRAREVLGWRPALDALDTIIETAWRWHQAPRY
ncbi:MAG TPA: UDP-glucose 4-epimerase GalE [Nevskiaceae bacterium]|nr:UDP-glucose 4-epimerase GalE [Nevskiaceae bacterium]